MGSDLAAAAIHARGGVLGRELSIVPVEGQSEPQTLAAATETLLAANPNVVALFGLSDTDMVLAAAPVAAAHGRVFLSSGATSPKLPGQVPDYLFLACFGDNVQAAAGAEWAFGQLGARTVAVLFDPSESYPTLLQAYFVERFQELGGAVASVADLDPRAGEIELPAVGDVDLVFLSLETAEDAARVVPLLRAAGYAGPILGGDGYDAESVWADAPGVADVYFTTHVFLGGDDPAPEVSAFLEAWAEAHLGEPPSAFAALGYDAVGLIAAALEAAGEATPAAVATGLRTMGDYRGVTGTIRFEGDDRIPTKSVSILRIVDGEQAFVAEVIPEEVPEP